MAHQLFCHPAISQFLRTDISFNDVSKDSPINRNAKTNIAHVQAWGLSAMIKIWGWSVRFPQAGYSEEAILSNRLCLIEPHNIVHLKHVLLYKPSILLANIQLFPQPWFYKKRKKKQIIWSVWQTIAMKLYNLVNRTGYLSELKKKICMYEIPKPHANFITLTLRAEATYLERSKGFCSHIALFFPLP